MTPGGYKTSRTKESVAACLCGGRRSQRAGGEGIPVEPEHSGAGRRRGRRRRGGARGRKPGDLTAADPPALSTQDAGRRRSRLHGDRPHGNQV
ncbi:hypothetical protein AAFF_G00075320 [Aldrovandia affinis]|uniref:Uncharacterized protein n=1 Tax=Aldrovandia affinis TaxID=143900 RepID=A0AAD7RY89_9TELE|nr:hypothetical protein AAFF_G00075320 [Aldrovandia affinis]